MKALMLVIFVTAVLATPGFARNPSDPDELAALLPAASEDSLTGATIRATFCRRQFAAAAELSGDMIRSHPENWEGYFWKGAAAIQQREFYAAVRNLRSAERLGPPGNAVVKNLAIAYYLLDQRQLFELKMREAMAAEPGDFSPYYFLGRYYLSSTGFEVSAAAQSFARALERKPDDAASTCFYGLALESMGAFDRARERFLLAVHLGGAQGPIASVAFQALSRLTLAEDTAVALAFARKAVTAEPASAAALLQLAKSAAAGGDRDRQLSALRAAAALAESEVRPMYQLMQIYRQMDDEADARLAAAAYKRRVSCFGKEGSETR